MTTPAGWYPDPEQPTNQRYWDGQQWTERAGAPAAGARMKGFGRSEDDVSRAVAAILWRHSKTDPFADTSRCRGGETRCAFPMDADAFYRHQGRAVVDEVLVPELDWFVQQTDLAAQTVERIAEIAATAAHDEAPRLSNLSPLLMRSSKSKSGRDLHGWSGRIGGWLIYLVLGAALIAALVKACSA